MHGLCTHLFGASARTVSPRFIQFLQNSNKTLTIKSKRINNKCLKSTRGFLEKVGVIYEDTERNR